MHGRQVHAVTDATSVRIAEAFDPLVSSRREAWLHCHGE